MAVIPAIGLAVSIAATGINVTTNEKVRNFFSRFGSKKDELEKLERSFTLIKATLRDVDSKLHGLTSVGELWVKNLKDAAYDIDDLLDECVTVAEQSKHLKDAHSKDADIFKSFFKAFKRKCKITNSPYISTQIKALNKKMEEMKEYRTNFSIPEGATKLLKLREETSCKLPKEIFIGREKDLEDILGQVLSNSPKIDDVHFVCIVGIGGLGKTALAKHVFHNKDVIREFPERRWVCVSENFSPKYILDGILKRRTDSLEQAAEEVQKVLKSKKFLLVLDDVWNEKSYEWRKLKFYLASDLRGSKIIITTRSQKVGESIQSSYSSHLLEGLSEYNSWLLFKNMAFGTGREDKIDPKLAEKLAEMGKDISKKCANVPLSIIVIATLLYGQPIETWQSFREIELPAIRDENNQENEVMLQLGFSYFQLDIELKSCFAFCSIFPKDHIMEKELLIQLWSSQGYLVATEGQSIEEVGDRYITLLLNRCFFQDVVLDKDNVVYSFKLHDLMHDLALKVAGEESFMMTKDHKRHSMKKIRHLSIDRESGSSDLCLSDTLRTCFLLKRYDGDSSLDKVPQKISKCKRLRVLSLKNLGIDRTLTNELGKLLHLRYLDLSYNRFELLPNSTYKLCNLQILKLRGCASLKKLPKKMSQLVNLTTLDIWGCTSLTHMPNGMSKLEKLHTLTRFVVDGVHVNQTKGSKLEELKALGNLKGDLRIDILNFEAKKMPQDTDGAFISEGAHLKNLDLRCGTFCCDNEVPTIMSYNQFYDHSDQSQVHERLVKNLCPNKDICSISMAGYQGTKLPIWASLTLSQFGLLKVLKLFHLENVEYLESLEIARDATTSVLTSGTFFPVLEKLELKNMPKLKGWSEIPRVRRGMKRKSGGLVAENGLRFPRLEDLEIKSCRSMICFPSCPLLKRLYLRGVNDRLVFRTRGAPASSLSLQHLDTDNASVFKIMLSLYQGLRNQLTFLTIRSPNLKALPECIGSLTSLQVLKVEFPRLDSVPEFMRCLTSLRNLQFLHANERLRAKCDKTTGDDRNKISHIDQFHISGPSFSSIFED